MRVSSSDAFGQRTSIASWGGVAGRDATFQKLLEARLYRPPARLRVRKHYDTLKANTRKYAAYKKRQAKLMRERRAAGLA